MKKALIAIGLITSTTCAYATPPKTVPDINPSLQLETNIDLDAAAKAQAAALSKASSESASKALSGSASGATSDSGGNSQNLQTGAQTSTSISSNRWLNLPSHVVPVPPSFIAGANVVQTVGSCGVLQKVNREQVSGTFHGLFNDSTVNLGFRESLGSYTDVDGNVQLFKEVRGEHATYIIGHQPVILSTVVSTGGARQFGLGGNSSSGNNGSGSLGTSGANQQMVEHIQLMECIFQIVENKPVQKTSDYWAPAISKKIGE